MIRPNNEKEAYICPACGGKLDSGTYDHVVGGEQLEHQISGEIRWIQLIVLGVPALVCTTCGSPWVTADDGVLEVLQAHVRTCAEQGVFVSTVRYSSLAPTTH
jgi:hypothetical protein